VRLSPIIQVPAGWTAVAGRFGVHVFEGHLPVSDMDRMQKLGDEWFRKNPGKLVELVIVYPSRAMMSAEERHRMTQLIKRWEAHRVAAATVILATGMLGAVQRSVLTGLLMIAPPPHPSKVFSDLSEAVTWLLPHVAALSERPITEEHLRAAVEELCAAFRAR
jgi:hypothetical protein